MENENQKAISKLLGLDRELLYGKGECASWPTIYAEIGRLQEQAQRNNVPVTYPVWQPPQEVNKNPNLHYHNGIPCYNNPCTWC